MTNSSNSVKRCPKCENIYPATPEYFHRRRGTIDGLQRKCITCHDQDLQDVSAGQEKTKRDYRHVVIPQVPDGYKFCKHCENILPATLEYFHRDSSKLDGFHGICAECRCNKGKKWRAENPEESAAQHRANYENNRKRIIENVRRYTERHKEERAAYEREYWQKNVDKRQAKHVRRKAAKKRLPNTFTAQDWERCLDYWEHRCAVCGRAADETTVLSPDHWIALTDPREDNPGTVPTNIVPLCGSLKGGRNGCNNSKHKRNAVTWLIEKYGEDEAQIILERIRAYFESL